MSNPTPAQAKAELKRRALPKSNDKRAQGVPKAVKDGTFDLPTLVLMTLAGSTPAPKGKATPAPKAPKAKAPADPRKVLANQAWKLAFDAAPDGHKRRTAGKAYKAVLNGASIEQVQAALAKVTV